MSKAAVLLLVLGHLVHGENIGSDVEQSRRTVAAEPSPLAGRKFCRRIYNPLLERAGHKDGEAEHCISFGLDGKLIDNGNKILGHPEEKMSYRLQGDEILVPEGTGWTPFPFSFKDGALKDSAGNILNEKPAADKSR